MAKHPVAAPFAHAEGKTAQYMVRAAACHAMRAIGWPHGFDAQAIWPGFMHEFKELSPADDLAAAEALISAARSA
jgi:hypothetical protein